MNTRLPCFEGKYSPVYAGNDEDESKLRCFAVDQEPHGYQRDDALRQRESCRPLGAHGVGLARQKGKGRTSAPARAILSKIVL